MSAVTVPATLRDALQVVDLRAADLPEAVEVLARGMRDNPVHVAAYGPDPERRVELIRTAFRTVFATSAHQEPFGLRWDGVLVAVTGVAPPGTCRPGLAQRVRMAPTMARLGPRTASRVGRWLGEWARHDPDAPHAHLGPLAVDSALQGRGIGTVLLAEHCRRVDLAGQVSYLETDKPENVRFYRRAGFEVVREGDVLGVPNWYMRREPVVSPSRPGAS
jgi:ribosomal protein S18 acetylase RimI-like enzyme